MSLHPNAFTAGNTYTRKDVYRTCGLPEETRGGNWGTGYHSHDGDWFIFATIGTAGRSGHNYDNGWEGSSLRWRGRTNSHLKQPSIISMVDPDAQVFIFTRNDDRPQFHFRGCGKAVRTSDTRPVTIWWEFDSEKSVTAGELLQTHKFWEGAIQQVKLNAYERNPKAREDCIAHHGTTCAVCNFNFEQVYGELGRGFVHVHHLVDLASIGEEYEVDAINDLRPVCPNCHAMLHQRTPSLRIEELTSVILARR